MNKGGRPKDPIWQHFTEIQKEKQNVAKCNECGYVLAGKPNRMKGHFEKCKRDHGNASDAKVPQKRNRSESPPSKRLAVSDSLLQPQINVIKTSSDKKGELDLQIAKFFYACNIPFNVAEHTEFLKTIKLLRPGYSPPNRKTISGDLLDKVSEEMHGKMKKELDGKTATLVQDGWSNCHNDPVIASSVQSGGKTFFLDSYDTGSMPKTAENCKSLCEESIERTKQKYNCTIRTVVTDNARNMNKMRDALKQDHPDIIVYGCSAHLLNLLGEDITPSNVIKHAKDVNKYFRNHHRPCAWLNEIGESVKPQLPGDTRWKSQLTCLESFVKNRRFYQQICEEHENEIDANISKKILDMSIYRNAKDLIEQLRPVASAIDTCQSDKTSIADACHTWLSLGEDQLLSVHKILLTKRIKQAVTPEHIAAYKLHPKYRGEKLSTEHLNILHEYLQQQNPDYIASLIAFEGQSLPFPPAYFTETATEVHPVTWWKGLQQFNVDTGFINLAIQLLSSPPSSASIERIFSNFGAIHTKIRNRLGNAKAAKLVFCYRMLRGDQELDY